MELELQGKVAFVAAGSRGLGKAIALQLAAEGVRVVICSRKQEAVEQAAREISNRTGETVIPLKGDVSKSEDIKEMIGQTVKRFGSLDILLCNGGGPPGGTFETFDDNAWQQAFETNLLSVVRLVREALPYIRDGGRILTVASSSVKEPIPGLILSNTMRAGVVGLMKSLARELGPRRILVNTVCPGRIETDRVTELDQARAKQQGTSQEAVQKAYVEQIPLGRYGAPEEFAKVVAFLASEANTYMTGSVFMVDGGLVKASL